jgi:phosphoglycerate dehydrogenase-like enzyme
MDMFPDMGAAVIGAVRRAPGVRWLHTMSAGVDHPVFRSLIDRGIELTTSSGAAAKPIAHTVMLYVLAHGRRLLERLDAQRAHRWEQGQNRDIDGARMLVVGMGPIGVETVKVAQAFGMEVRAVRRTPSPDDPCPTAGLDTLASSIGDADYVVSALPLNDDTKGIFSAQIIASMKPGAFFVNVGRGGLVDEPALIDALRTGHLGGAGLDVFAVEPLPGDSPLWDLPKVIVTPHNSAAVPGTGRAVEAIFLDNLRRDRAGEPKRNVAR